MDSDIGITDENMLFVSILPRSTGSISSNEEINRLPCNSDNKRHLTSYGSFNSLNSLHGFQNRQHKSRSYLVGSIGGVYGSMLGAKELQKNLPNNRINVHIATWNMASSKSQFYPEYLEDIFYPESASSIAELYAICIQEAPNDRQEILIRLQSAIGPKHVLFAQASHGSLLISLFIARELIWYLSVPQSTRITTRAAIKTKGACALSFILFGTTFLFICSHLKANEGNYDARVQDYQKIINNMDLPRRGFSRGFHIQDPNPMGRFDVVFWAGDLNFRIKKPRHVVSNLLNAGEEGITKLLAFDELIQGQIEGSVFAEFIEGRILFPPTYKYDVNSDVYDSSDRQRSPAYTDRILFRSRKSEELTCIDYNHIPTIKSSDHRPVYGIYAVTIKPGQDNIALLAGAFERDVYIAGNRRRALRFDLAGHLPANKESRICEIQ